MTTNINRQTAIEALQAAHDSVSSPGVDTRVIWSRASFQDAIEIIRALPAATEASEPTCDCGKSMPACASTEDCSGQSMPSPAGVEEFTTALADYAWEATQLGIDTREGRRKRDRVLSLHRAEVERAEKAEQDAYNHEQSRDIALKDKHAAQADRDRLRGVVEAVKAIREEYNGMTNYWTVEYGFVVAALDAALAGERRDADATEIMRLQDELAEARETIRELRDGKFKWIEIERHQAE